MAYVGEVVERLMPRCYLLCCEVVGCGGDFLCGGGIFKYHRAYRRTTQGERSAAICVTI